MLSRAWYEKAGWLALLRPLSWLFGKVSSQRRTRLQSGAQVVPCPVVIVGNITVGGSGKTPLLLSLIELCLEQGIRPGVISRGYGSEAKDYPLEVFSDTDPKLSGDEPAMIALRSGVPVVVDPDRVRAAQFLLEKHKVDLILSDDGLQHYRLARDFEIAVVDAQRGLGNGRLMPEGPLREPGSRLAEVDLVVLNGQGEFTYPGALSYRLNPVRFINLKTGEHRAPNPSALGAHQVNALAGIGNPERFFRTLQQLGFEVNPMALADHAVIDPELVNRLSDRVLLMTEKDAVKCTQFANTNCWALCVDAVFDQSGRERIKQYLATLSRSSSGDIHGS